MTRRDWLAAAFAAPAAGAGDQARANARDFDRGAAAMDRCMRAWLREADPRTGLLPERIAGGRGYNPATFRRRYVVHNSAADLYCYLVLTAELTDPGVLRGPLTRMLQTERRLQAANGLPTDYDFDAGKPGAGSLFGAAEYAKDGLVSVVELLGRGPWFTRLREVVDATLANSTLETRWGKLPSADAEVNGDLLQSLARLIPATGETVYRAMAHRIVDAYCQEILPGSGWLPPKTWDFAARKGSPAARLRDHGNEAIAGLTLIYCLERHRDTTCADRWRPALVKMYEAILGAVNEDGMLPDEVDIATGRATRPQLADNWGYVYGSLYAFDQSEGAERFRPAIRRVLGNLPKYRGYNWESGSFDGVADAVESALYLVNREPVPAALAWIDAEMEGLLARQQPDGFLEKWYGEGNFNRTVYLWMLMKSQGCRPAGWRPGLGVGAVRDGDALHLHLAAGTRVRFDFARHKSFFNLPLNFVRLNEFPEWFTVDPLRTYQLRSSSGRSLRRPGRDLIRGIDLPGGDWTVSA